jgi:hypothetical protein|tara:strand:+ start:398 stop:736 length:339 start_codon:yes stop_codon:yes gene_type:complete
MGYTLEGNEMALIVRPVMQDDDWTGHVETGIACSSELDIGSSVQRSMVHYITLMAAFLSWGNDNPDILDEVIAFRDGLLAEEDGWDIDGELETPDGDNIIRLNRWTKTEGSA